MLTSGPGQVGAVQGSQDAGSLDRAAREASLRQVLQPILVDALRVSIRKDPALLAETLFPVIGAAVRRAVAAALQDMTDSLNQIVESSLSLRSLQWRLEAARTGKSYSEVALLRSLLYRVEQVFLIHRATGLLLCHAEADASLVTAPDLISGMLTALQDFVHDSFGATSQTLEMVRVGELSVWIQHGPRALLAGIVRGTPPSALRTTFSAALETIHRDFAAPLNAFDGDAGPLEATRPALAACLLGQCPPERRRSFAPVYALTALGLLLIAGWAAFSFARQRRWDAYLSALGAEPGIVVTHQERHGGRFAISGLRDPLARDPAQLLQPAGIAPERVASHWEAYFSAAPAFLAQREFAESRAFLERQVIPFPTEQSSLTPAASALLAGVADRAGRLFETAASSGAPVRLEIDGHADPSGTPELNVRLIRERAATVRQWLAAAGVAAEGMTVQGGGAANPSVTFRVLTGR